MTQQEAFRKAAKISREKKTTRFVVWDGEEFGGDSCGQGGYQVSSDADLDGFYNGCAVIAVFSDGRIEN